MSRLAGWWERFWFAEAPAARLAVLRVLVGVYAGWLLQFRYEEILEATLLPVSQWEPVGVLGWLRTPLSAEVVRALLVAAVVLNVPFVLGWWFRLSGPLFAGLLVTVISFYASWGSVNHPDALLVAHVGLLAFLPAADALSLDALFKRGQAARSSLAAAETVAPSVGWRYGFGLKLICTVTALTYLLAGIAKVSGPNGWAWGTGDALLTQVAWDGLRKELLGKPPPPEAAFLYEHVWLFTLLAIGSLVTELGAPLVLLSRRLGYAWGLAALPMHWGIYYVMGISFKYYLWGVAYASFFPLELALVPFERSLGAALGRFGGRLAGLRAPWPAGRPALTVDRRVAAAAGALVLGVGLFGAGLYAGRAIQEGPAPQPAARLAATPSRTVGGTVSTRPGAAGPAPGGAQAPRFPITFVGDLIPGSSSRRLLEQNGYTWPYEHVRHLLAGSYAIGNLEAPITERTESYFPTVEFDYNARPAAARALAEVGFDAVGFSNNHTLDRGPEGLADTLRYLREAGVTQFGAGLDVEEAGAPLLVPTPHGTVAVLAFGDNWKSGAAAGPAEFGTIPFLDANIVFYAEQARAAGARWVVAFVHWGENYRPIEPEQPRVAERFARAGYDLVIGHHPHIAQPVDIVQGMPVLYSLGNFVVGTTGRFTPETPGYGLVARVSFEQGGLGSIELTCILTDNNEVKFQPRPCDEPRARELMRSLGPSVAWRNGRGVVQR
jgi:hypothetical protein